MMPMQLRRLYVVSTRPFNVQQSDAREETVRVRRDPCASTPFPIDVVRRWSSNSVVLRVRKRCGGGAFLRLCLSFLNYNPSDLSIVCINSMGI